MPGVGGNEPVVRNKVSVESVLLEVHGKKTQDNTVCRKSPTARAANSPYKQFKLARRGRGIIVNATASFTILKLPRHPPNA